MKKLLALFLAILILSTSLSALATSINTKVYINPDIADDQPQHINGICAYNNEVFTCQAGQIYKYDIQNDKFSYYASLEGEENRNYNEIFNDKDGLVLFKRDKFELYKLIINDSTASLGQAYNIQSAKELLGNAYISNIFISDENIVFVSIEMNTNICKLNIATGKASMQSTKYYFNSCALYKGDNLIANSEGKLTMYDGDKLEEIVFKLNQNLGYNDCLMYDKVKDILYVCDQNFVYIVNEDASLKKASFLGGEIISKGTVVGDTLVYLNQQSQISSQKIDPNNMPESFVKIIGDFSFKTRNYNKANPTLPCISMEEFLPTANDIAQHMKGENAADIYFIDSIVGIKSLFEHGYVEPLNQYPKFMQSIERCYPYLKDSVMFNGQLSAFPIRLTGVFSCYQYNPASLSVAGLSEQDMPKTYDKFLDFITKYQNELSVNYPDIKLYDGQPWVSLYQNLLYNMVIQTYAQSSKQNELASYSNPELMQIANKLANTDFYGIGDAKDGDNYMMTDDDKPSYYFAEKNQAFGQKPNFKTLALKFNENDEQLIPVTVLCAVINPLSKNKENAVKALEYIIDNYGTENSTEIYTDLNEPVIDEALNISYNKMEKEKEKAIAEIEEAKEIDPKNVKAMEQNLKYIEDELRWLERNRYLLTKDDIEAYNQFKDNYYVLNSMVFNYRSEQMMQLLSRFFEKNIDVQSFLTELDRYSKMMTLEGQ